MPESLPLPGRPLPTPCAEDLRTIHSTTLLLRLYFRGGRHPTTWNAFRHLGPLNSRFDPHPQPDPIEQLPPPAHHPDHGVLYCTLHDVLGGGLPTVLAEVYQDTTRISPTANSPHLAAFSLHKELEVLSLSSDWLGRAGANTLLYSGPRYLSRAWTRAILEDFPTLRGFLYPSSARGAGLNLVLFSNVARWLPSEPLFDRPLSHPDFATRLHLCADRIGKVLVP